MLATLSSGIRMVLSWQTHLFYGKADTYVSKSQKTIQTIPPNILYCTECGVANALNGDLEHNFGWQQTLW